MRNSKRKINPYFQYKLAKVDMRNLYSSVIFEFDKVPQIVVCEELEDGNEILRRRIKRGRDIIYLKKSDDMIQVLKKELKEKKAPVYEAELFQFHDLRNEEVTMWYKVVLVLSEALGVDCPQVQFSSSLNGNAIAFEEQGMIALPDLGRNDARMMILIIAHELRHIWQNVYHPELQVDYVHVESDDDLEAYSLHPCEVDAEAYALNLFEAVWSVDPLVGGEPKVLAALLKRRKEIKVSLEDGVRAYLEILGELSAA